MSIYYQAREPGEELCLLEAFVSTLEGDYDTINILAGHAPLRVAPDPMPADFYRSCLDLGISKTGLFVDLHAWGDFSTYTWNLGLEIGATALRSGLEPRFIWLIDDHTFKHVEAHKLAGDSPPEHAWSQARDAFYQGSVGAGPQWPHGVGLLSYGSERGQRSEHTGARYYGDHILRHNHEKPGREHCQYWSEQVLRGTAETFDTFLTEELDTAFAREYGALLREPEIFGVPLISFIPRHRQSSICQALDHLIAWDLRRHGGPEFPSVHVYMESGVPVKEMYESGVWIQPYGQRRRTHEVFECDRAIQEAYKNR